MLLHIRIFKTHQKNIHEITLDAHHILRFAINPMKSITITSNHCRNPMAFQPGDEVIIRLHAPDWQPGKSKRNTLWFPSWIPWFTHWIWPSRNSELSKKWWDSIFFCMFTKGYWICSMYAIFSYKTGWCSSGKCWDSYIPAAGGLECLRGNGSRNGNSIMLTYVDHYSREHFHLSWCFQDNRKPCGNQTWQWNIPVQFLNLYFRGFPTAMFDHRMVHNPTHNACFDHGSFETTCLYRREFQQGGTIVYPMCARKESYEE